MQWGTRGIDARGWPSTVQATAAAVRVSLSALLTHPQASAAAATIPQRCMGRFSARGGRRVDLGDRLGLHAGALETSFDPVMRRLPDDPKKRRALLRAAERRRERREAHGRWASRQRAVTRLRKELGLPPLRLSRGIEAAPVAAWARQSSTIFRAPDVFSFIENPDAAAAFISTIERAATRQNKIFVDLRSLTRLTLDACTALRAMLDRVKFMASVEGSRPLDARINAMLDETGFFENLRVRGEKKPPHSGRMCSREGNAQRVDPARAKEYVRFAAERTRGPGTKHEASYSNLIECMANTRNHAAGPNARANHGEYYESWWLSVYHDAGTGISQFAFVDLGVGILKSAKLHPLRRMLLKARTFDPGKTLQMVLDGEVESRTGFAHRGRGLPRIASSCRDGEVRRLVIVSNDAYVDVDKGVQQGLTRELSGTLIYWEMHPDAAGEQHDRHVA